MTITGILVLQLMMILRSTSGQFGGGGGGPSNFGYDGSSACSKPYSRHSRARFEKLPCDFRRQNWCTIAGNAYPWHAVRRFVQENQGLMRRMYGDERHINVLKAELEKNDIELEMDERYQRYPGESRRFQYEDEYEDLPEKRARSKYFDEYISEGRSFKESIVIESSTERTSPHPGTPTSPELTTEPPKTSTARIIDEASTLPVVTTEKIREANSSLIVEKVSSTIPAVTLADLARIKNSSINEIPGQQPERIENSEDFGKPGVSTTESTFKIENSTFKTESNLSSTSSTFAPASSSPSIDRIDLGEQEDLKNSSPVDQMFAASDEEPQQQFRPRPDFRPPESKPSTPHHEGQLFQDVAAKDKEEKPVLKFRGVNACPVKEEVVAPFWANNTRGEVLALLNLYPFEQYVHWEKCTHENRQMYCRDGCRCEQQYRLHRLLAYDPSNECRGIFSDWFKFPSCCVCRCYDLPIEFRVTSRSPRVQKQKLKLRPPGYARD